MPPLINRIGLVFDFLSFWLVGAEMLGEDRLKSLEAMIERGFASILRRFQKIYHRMTGRLLPQNLNDFLIQEKSLVRSLIAAFLVCLFVLLKQFLLPSKTASGDSVIMMSVLINLLAVVIVSGIGIALAAITLSHVLRYLSEGEEGQQLRHLLLWIGVIVFLAGSALQFAATF